MENNFANKLIEWYKINQRDLPWRKTNDPYKIWVSEIILQQTRIDQGTPYYLNFINLLEIIGKPLFEQEFKPRMAKIITNK